MKLWDVALRSAHDTTSTHVQARINALAARELALDVRASSIEDAAASQLARYEAQDAALALARDQRRRPIAGRSA